MLSRKKRARNPPCLLFGVTNMSLRIVKTIPYKSGTGHVYIYRNSQWGEYEVSDKPYRELNGNRDRVYYDSDHSAALDHANHIAGTL